MSLKNGNIILNFLSFVFYFVTFSTFLRFQKPRKQSLSTTMQIMHLPNNTPPTTTLLPPSPCALSLFLPSSFLHHHLLLPHTHGVKVLGSCHQCRCSGSVSRATLAAKALGMVHHGSSVSVRGRMVASNGLMQLPWHASLQASFSMRSARLRRQCCARCTALGGHSPTPHLSALPTAAQSLCCSHRPRH